MLIEIKSNLPGINSRVDEAKNQMNDLEHKEAKNKKKKEPPRRQNGDSVSSLWVNFKHSNIHIIGKGKRKSKKLEIYLKK